MEFLRFKQKMQENFKSLIENQSVLYVTDVDKQLIYDTYLAAFPESERQEHTCNSCKQFLRPYGNVVVIVNNELKTIWDFDCDEPYHTVAQSLHNLVVSAPIRDVFVTKISKLGTDYNHEALADGTIQKWQHFHLQVPSVFVTSDSHSEESVMARYRDARNVFKRSLDEITLDSIETTLELIKQKSLYRGEEFKGIVTEFLKYKKEYTMLPENKKDNYCWAFSIKAGNALSKIKNSAIGTLLIDISEGKELDLAVRAFERIMAPANYKRPNAIITQGMIDKAQKRIVELGLENSLGRRHANIDDITVNNVLFANRLSKKAMNVFDELSKSVGVNTKKFSKIEEMSINDFIDNVLPTATSLELLMENRHSQNLMSVIAPKMPSPTMFKWDNNFSWSYNGEVADSMKERVKAAGGNVEGVLRFSICWNEEGNNNIDFDAHCIEPNGNEISFRHCRKPSMSLGTGQLDVDIVNPNSEVAVENITWSNINKMLEGKYKFFVNNFSSYESKGGFTAEVEYGGEIYKFEYNNNLRGKQDIVVAEIEFSKADGIKIIKSLDSTTTIRNIWGVNTNQFQTVSMLMHSPNHWDGHGIGNRHYFFILEGCLNPETPRGFYNEFLKEELMQDKQVFEALGSKLRVEASPNQLSGLGFSTTVRNSIVCKVEGTFSRTVKINF